MEKTFWLLGIHRYIIAETTETNGKYDLIEGFMPAGAQTPAHIHHGYTETEYVLDGELTITFDNRTIVLKSGQGFTIPQGAKHALSCTSNSGTKIITVFAPAGFAQVIRQAGIPGTLANGIPDQHTDMELFNRLSVQIGDETILPII
jgi:quercetin dioxygenase-like cupin family protein